MPTTPTIPNKKTAALDGRDGLDFVLRTAAPSLKEDRTDVHIFKSRA